MGDGADGLADDAYPDEREDDWTPDAPATPDTRACIY